MWNTCMLVRSACREVQRSHCLSAKRQGLELLSTNRTCTGLEQLRCYSTAKQKDGSHEDQQGQEGEGDPEGESSRRRDYSHHGSEGWRWTWSNIRASPWKWRAPIVSLAGATGEFISD